MDVLTNLNVVVISLYIYIYQIMWHNLNLHIICQLNLSNAVKNTKPNQVKGKK